jgi:hypothetical protein
MCQQCKIDDMTNPHSRLNSNFGCGVDGFNYINNFIIKFYKIGSLFEHITANHLDQYCIISYKVVMKNHHPDIYKKYITYLLLK